MHSPRSRVLLRVFSGAALLLGVGAMTGVPAHAAQSANVPASSSSSPRPRVSWTATVSAPRRRNCGRICAPTSAVHQGRLRRQVLRQRPLHRPRRARLPFLSNAPGSGGNVTFTETLGRDPAATPGNTRSRATTSRMVRARPAPWFSMAMCDPNSYPRTPCTPELGLQRANLFRRQLRDRDPGRWLGVHGDAAVPAGLRAVRGQRELRQHALVRGAEHRQLEGHPDHATPNPALRGAGQLRLHPAERGADRAARRRSSPTSPRSRRTTARRCS